MYFYRCICLADGRCRALWAGATGIYCWLVWSQRAIGAAL